MKAYRIKDVKNFMGKLLGTEAFDSFLLAEASVTTYNTFVIDGHMEKAFFTGDIHDEPVLPPYEFSEWKNMRSLCFNLIKGKRTPVSFKFILHLKPELVTQILTDGSAAVTLSDIKAFVLNIKYDGSMLTCITATAFYTFLPDKTPDRLWDDFINRFLVEKDINFEEI
ncbi:MAG: DUF5721 family protein [Clostridium sp.]|nr:DUF5721 family protein [Clostridium sp.]